jgi:hypothetical protein
VVDCDCCLCKEGCAILVGKRAQANEGMGGVRHTCPDKAAGGRAVADARVALATKRLGQPLAMRSPTIKVWGL